MSWSKGGNRMFDFIEYVRQLIQAARDRDGKRWYALGEIDIAAHHQALSVGVVNREAIRVRQ
jgi:hypothetical protein